MLWSWGSGNRGIENWDREWGAFRALPSALPLLTFPPMELFEFIIIIVLITTIGKVVMAVGAPLIDKLGDLVRELAASKRGEGTGLERGELDRAVLEELENRLARIEDRLDFLEELKAPDRRRAIGDRGGASGRGERVGGDA